MRIEDFEKLLEEMSLKFVSQTAPITSNTSKPILLELNLGEEADYFLRDGVYTEIAGVYIDGMKYASIGFDKNGDPAICMEEEFVKKASDDVILRILSVVPSVFAEFVEKISDDDSETLIGVVGIANVLNRDDVRDALRTAKRVVKKTTTKITDILDEQAFINGFNTAIRVYKKLIKDGWVLKSSGKGQLELYYGGTIVVDVIRENGRLYPIPEKLLGDMYVKGVHIPLNSKITSIYVDEAVHPNVSEDGNVCLGDGYGIKLENILDVISLLRTANLESAFSNKGTLIARAILNEILNGASDGDDTVVLTSVDIIGGEEE